MLLKANPDLPDALLELANLRILNKQNEKAIELLRRYVKVAREPASGYYKLAMVERSLKQNEAAARDLNVFQTLSKNASTGPYPYQHLFDYLDNRATLAPQERTQLDLTQLLEQVQKHPDQPQDLYLLAETYLKLGKIDEARDAIVKLDQLEFRRLSHPDRCRRSVSPLSSLRRCHRAFPVRIGREPWLRRREVQPGHCLSAPRKVSEALASAQQISAPAQQDDAYLSLLGDIYSHLGDAAKASEIFRSAIRRNPDNDQYYLSLAMVQLRQNDVGGATDTLQKGLARVPSSGKLLWGMGLVSVLNGNTPQAAERLERAVELLPEWAGSYSTLGVFYYQTGQVEKAREVLNRFKGSHAGGLDVNRIEEALSRAPATTASANQPLPDAARRQLLQLALSLADRTL